MSQARFTIRVDAKVRWHLRLFAWLLEKQANLFAWLLRHGGVRTRIGAQK